MYTFSLSQFPSAAVPDGSYWVALRVRDLVAFNATAAMEAYRGASSDDGLTCVLAPLTFSVSGTSTQGLGVTVNSTALYVLDATAPVVAPGTQCLGTAVQVCDPGSATPVTCQCTPLRATQRRGGADRGAECHPVFRGPRERGGAD